MRFHCAVVTDDDRAPVPEQEVLQKLRKHRRKLDPRPSGSKKNTGKAPILVRNSRIGGGSNSPRPSTGRDTSGVSSASGGSKTGEAGGSEEDRERKIKFSPTADSVVAVEAFMAEDMESVDGGRRWCLGCCRG